MKKNYIWIRYLGLLGLLGILGYITNNSGFYGFFGFFGFFAYSGLSNDERLETNVNKAAKNSLIFSIIIFAIVTIYASLTSNALALAYGFAVNFGLQLFVFGISLSYYENR